MLPEWLAQDTGVRRYGCGLYYVGDFETYFAELGVAAGCRAIEVEELGSRYLPPLNLEYHALFCYMAGAYRAGGTPPEEGGHIGTEAFAGA